MATNHQRVTEGFEILTEVLAPFVARELRARYDDEWWVLRVLFEGQRRDLPEASEDEELMKAFDAAHCPIVVDQNRNDLFRMKLAREHRNWVKELIQTRNK